jgi:hypothetical protein
VILVALEEIFEVKYGVNLELNKLEQVENGINFVSRTAKNNGVSAVVKKLENLKPIDEGVLTVAGGGSVLETFLQPEPFYSGRDLYYLIPKIELTQQQKLYYCMAIRANKYRYSYGRQANRTLRNLLVPSVDEIPEWVEGYDVSRFDDAPLALEKNNIDLPTLNAKSRLDEIFAVYNGIASTKIELYSDKRENSIAFVRPASTHQRTLSGFLDKDSVETKHIYPKGTLFVSTNGEGSHSYSYVSTMEFVPNSDVSVLVPKEDMSVEEKIYYSLCITKNRYRFSYGRKPKGKRLKSLILPKIRNDSESEKIISFIRSLAFSSSI